MRVRRNDELLSLIPLLLLAACGDDRPTPDACERALAEMVETVEPLVYDMAARGVDMGELEAAVEAEDADAACALLGLSTDECIRTGERLIELARVAERCDLDALPADGEQPPGAALASAGCNRLGLPICLGGAGIASFIPNPVIATASMAVAFHQCFCGHCRGAWRDALCL